MNDNTPSQHFNHFPLLRLSFGLLLIGAGCQSDFLESRFDSVVEGDDLNNVSPVSTKHNNRGLRYFSKGKIAKAESHFQRALNSDPRSAAAHNNVGNMHLARRELYQAAWEFQRASELAPNRIEPLINLGLVHEEADRLEEAADYYRRALETSPNDPVAAGNLARTLIKLEADPSDVNALLRHLVFIDSRPDWVQWAEELLATRYRLDFIPIDSSQTVPATMSFDSIPPETILLAPQPNSPSNLNLGGQTDSLPNVNVSPIPSRQELLPSPLAPPQTNQMVAPPIQIPDQAILSPMAPSTLGLPFPNSNGVQTNSNGVQSYSNGVQSAAFEAAQQPWPIYPSPPVLEGNR